MSIQENGGDLIGEGMLLKLNRNTREAKGYYYINKNSDDVDKYDFGVKESRYPVEMKDNKIFLTKKLKIKI